MVFVGQPTDVHYSSRPIRLPPRCVYRRKGEHLNTLNYSQEHLEFLSFTVVDKLLADFTADYHV